MPLIFLSPHLDDAVYSFGGFIWELTHSGESVEIWTLFSAGEKERERLSPFALQLHSRWNAGNDPAAIRRGEDIKACNLLGCGWKHLGYADCIYRWDKESGIPIIQNNEDLFLPIRTAEKELVQEINERLSGLVNKDDILLAPLAIGGHVDHRIVRKAVENAGLNHGYYADFPYAVSFSKSGSEIIPRGFVEKTYRINVQVFSVWSEAIEAYHSQFNSFWNSRQELREDLSRFIDSSYGGRLWVRK